MGEYGDARARVLLEAVGPTLGATMPGVPDDAFIFRLREAYAGWIPGRMLRVQLGVVPTLTIPEVEGTWRLRAVAPTALERSTLGSPADLGATVRVKLPRSFGWVGLGAYNSEGYTGRELDRGKGVELAASVPPIPAMGFAPLAMFASYTVGTSGVASTRADRLTAGLLWQGTTIRAGAVGTIAWGVAGDAGRVAYLIKAFARVEPLERLLLGLRYTDQQRDDRLDGSRDPLGARYRGIPGHRPAGGLRGGGTNDARRRCCG